MNKFVLILGGFFLVVLLLIFLVILPSAKIQQPVHIPTLPTPTSVIIPQITPTQAPIPTGKTVIIDNIPVNNFYPSTTPFNPEGDRTIADIDGQYRIVYTAQDQQFLINIEGSPFEQYRQVAEQTFLQKMGISQQQACNLNLVIRTPSFVNPDQAGQDYFLSFCQ